MLVSDSLRAASNGTYFATKKIVRIAEIAGIGGIAEIVHPHAPCNEPKKQNFTSNNLRADWP